MPLREVDGTAVSYRDAGAGDPVVFLHSGPGSAADWRAVFDRFPAGFRLVALNGFGRGETAPWPSGEVHIDHTADLASRLISLLEPPVHLVGHSYGGAVALRLAVTSPGSLRSLAVIEPQVYPLLREAAPDLFEESKAVAEEFASAVADGRLEDGWRGFIDHYSLPGNWERLPPPAKEAMVAISDPAVRSWRALFTHPITTSDLAGVSLPTLVIQGGRSTAPEQRMCEIVADSTPNAQRIVIDDAAHMVPLTHPSEVVDALLPHLHDVERIGDARPT